MLQKQLILKRYHIFEEIYAYISLRRDSEGKARVYYRNNCTKYMYVSDIFIKHDINLMIFIEMILISERGKHRGHVRIIFIYFFYVFINPLAGILLAQE